jgi:hypothetical protein
LLFEENLYLLGLVLTTAHAKVWFLITRTRMLRTRLRERLKKVIK